MLELISSTWKRIIFEHWRFSWTIKRTHRWLLFKVTRRIVSTTISRASISICIRRRSPCSTCVERYRKIIVCWPNSWIATINNWCSIISIGNTKFSTILEFSSYSNINHWQHLNVWSKWYRSIPITFAYGYAWRNVASWSIVHRMKISSNQKRSWNVSLNRSAPASITNWFWAIATRPPHRRSLLSTMETSIARWSSPRLAWRMHWPYYRRSPRPICSKQRNGPNSTLVSCDVSSFRLARKEETKLYPAPPGNPLRIGDMISLKCSILTAAAYVSLSLNDFLAAKNHASQLLEESRASSGHKYASRMTTEQFDPISPCLDLDTWLVCTCRKVYSPWIRSTWRWINWMQIWRRRTVIFHLKWRLQR